MRTTLIGFALAALVLTGCTPGCQKPAPGDDDDTSIDARLAIDAVMFDAAPAFDQCAANGPDFVREAMLGLLGRRPRSQHEVDAYVALYEQVDAAHKAGKTTDAPRAVVARALLAQPERMDRWTAHFMDALRVVRIEDQDQSSCWGNAFQAKVDAKLATFVRDNAATTPTTGQWNMLDLAHSALALDDPTPMYRAHLFPLVSRAIPAANVLDPKIAELNRREDYGQTFDAVYLNRDIVCLGCHNSEFSTTDSLDPTKDRHWPLAGRVDEALYGMPSGEDPNLAHAVFRYDGFVGGGTLPWGMSSCGSFTAPSAMSTDVAGINGLFGTMTGTKLSVFDLEKALQHGFDTLRGGALAVDADGKVADKDAALAYVVSTNIVEGVWREVIGTKLTIANYFPRNQASRDILQQLTDHFIANKYSLDALLVEIVSSDYFARKPPEEGCGANAYSYPAVYDPWVIGDTDPVKHGNGPGDAVAPLSPRTLLGVAYAALEWKAPSDEQFPNEFGGSTGELDFLRSIGVFLKNGERGFRGLDFQARLGWEDRFGACKKPAGTTTDLIDRALAAGKAAPGASVGDVLAVIKDRLVGEPTVEAGAEQDATEALVGQKLSAPAANLTDASARRFCGVLASSPQFVLQGLPGRGGPAPLLSLTGDGFDDACKAIAGTTIKGWTITCTANGLMAVPAS